MKTDFSMMGVLMVGQDKEAQFSRSSFGGAYVKLLN